MIKRIFDFCAALVGLVVLAPLFFVVAVLIKLDSDGEVFFRQTRVGKGGKDFSIYKFRTMAKSKNKDDLQITVGADMRVTKIGKFLRKYRIDELPQLINVIKGDMSLVGPRPEVPEYVRHYPNGKNDIVLSLRPGITDLASINFKDEADILASQSNPEKAYIERILPKKLRYCRFYIKKRSFCYDIAIIFKTFMAVVK